MTQNNINTDNTKDKGHDNAFPQFKTDDQTFYTRFNFQRIIEGRPSQDSSILAQKTIAVHLHLFYLDLVPELVSYLNNIPFSFDLFISIPEQIQYDAVKLQADFSAIKHLHNVTIKSTTNRGRDIGPMLCTFKEDLQKYDFLLHIHTKKSPHGDILRHWRQFIFNHLLRSQDTVTYILQLLATDTAMVAPPDFIYLYHSEVWDWGNLEKAQEVIDHSALHIDLKEIAPCAKFPQGTMFWCRTDMLKDLLAMNFTYEDFPQEPIPPNGTIAHALERLFFIWNYDKPTRCCLIYHDQDEVILRERTEQECWERSELLRWNTPNIDPNIDHNLQRYKRKYRKYKRLTFITATLAIIFLLYIIVQTVLLYIG